MKAVSMASRASRARVRKSPSAAPFANARLRNRQTALSLQYAAGAYELGAEWIYDKLDYTTNGTDRKKLNGNQVSLNALYKF